MSASPRPLHFQVDMRRRTHSRWWVVGLMALMAGWCGMRWQTVVALEAQWQGLKANREEQEFLLEQRQNRPPTEDAAQVAVRAQIQKRIAAPWQALLAALDRAALPAASLLTLTPDVDNHQVRLTLEAISLEDALRYLDRLEAQPELAHAHLVSQAPAPSATAQVASSATGKSHFEVEAEWTQQ